MSKRLLEKAFWLIAAATLSVYALTVAERHFYQLYLDRQFTEMLELPIPAAQAPGLPSAVTLQHAKLAEGEVVGRLEIKSIQLSAMVAEGVSSTTLRRSIGHVPGTSLPGATGNVSLSAHRDSFFRHVGDLHKDDLISITTLAGTFDYAVESTSIVDPGDVEVLRDVGRPTVTLVTCYPFYYVGPAPKRFIVHAGLIRNQ